MYKFVDEKKNKPFRWGSWDCCKFSNGIIKAMTGESLIPKSLSWKNKETAMKSIKEYGGTLNASITKACKTKKLNKVDKNFITKGDLVVFKTPSDNRTDYIKRLIGLPGDEIQFINGELFINKIKI